MRIIMEIHNNNLWQATKFDVKMNIIWGANFMIISKKP